MSQLESYRLICGDARAVLRALPSWSVDAFVGDPPYELGFMGKAWDASGVAYDVALWREVFRVLKPGGHLLSFGGSRTYHRMACAVEDAGFEIRDQIQWLYGSGFPKSHNLEGEHEGWGTALKPAHEPIVLARRPLTGTIEENMSARGVGGLHIEAARVPLAHGDPLHAGVAHDGQSIDTGGADTRWGFKAVDRAAGVDRWPANVVHDGSAEVLECLPKTKSGTFNGKRSADKFRNTFGKFAGTVEGEGSYVANEGSAARFFYCAKASKRDREEGCEGLDLAQYSHDGRVVPIENAYQRNKSVSHNPHPTVKPTELMRWLVRMVTPVGGLVLDAFAGSGSTGKACALEGMRFLGIELEPAYVAIARARIDFALRKKEAAPC